MIISVRNFLRILIIGSIILLIVYLIYPEKTSETIESVEAIGSVAIEKSISRIEKSIGTADLALKHYENAKKEKKEALIQVKATLLELDRSAKDAEAESKQLMNNPDKKNKAEQKLSESVLLKEKIKAYQALSEKGEQGYKELVLLINNKKNDLKFIELKLQLLRTELQSVQKGLGSYSLEKAVTLENELKQLCDKLEAEVQVESLEQ